MKLKIYNETWDIKEVDQAGLKKFMQEDDERFWGACNRDDNEIMILKTLGTQRKRTVLVHEVTHAIRAMTLEFGEIDEEALANFVAVNFLEINKIVKEYFTPRKKKVRKKKVVVPDTIIVELPQA
jgi:Zn-dependent peptidase ImmA (M78 family)